MSHIRCKTKHPHQDRKAVSKLAATFCRLTRTRKTHTHTHKTQSTSKPNIQTTSKTGLAHRKKERIPGSPGHSDQTKKLYRQVAHIRKEDKGQVITDLSREDFLKRNQNCVQLQPECKSYNRYKVPRLLVTATLAAPSLAL